MTLSRHYVFTVKASFQQLKQNRRTWAFLLKLRHYSLWSKLIKKDFTKTNPVPRHAWRAFIFYQSLTETAFFYFFLRYLNELLLSTAMPQKISGQVLSCHSISHRPEPSGRAVHGGGWWIGHWRTTWSTVCSSAFTLTGRRGGHTSFQARNQGGHLGLCPPENFKTLHCNFDTFRNLQRIMMKFCILIIFKKSLIWIFFVLLVSNLVNKIYWDRPFDRKFRKWLVFNHKYAGIVKT